MSLTYSNMVELGTKAPDFKLIDVVKDKYLSFKDVRGERGTVVMFICNHCPYVIHIREKIVEIAHSYMSKGIGFVAISSNDIQNYPDDSPEKMRELSYLHNFQFPYLYDEDQSVAKSYNATCTPDFFLFGADNTCFYRGRMDGSSPGNGVEVTGVDLVTAIDALIGGHPPLENQLPSMGCNIKWIA